MNILITGGTGFIGTPLARELRGKGHSVTVTTRRPSDSKDKLTWSAPALIPPDIISRFDAVINLAGEPIAPRRWTKDRKERILSSRINTTRALVESIRQIEHTPLSPLDRGERKRLPKVLISASAVGFYGAHGDEYVTEDTPPAGDFLADVCKQWEAEAYKALDLGIRVVTVRIGGVLEADGGALPMMALPFKFFLGGPIGSGRQWFSWIHRDDIIGIIIFALENDSVSGPVNMTAPNPVTNREFSRSLGQVLHRPSFLAVPGIVVKLMLGELGAVLLTGQRVLPEKILRAGYRFKYSDVSQALRAILGK
ncbi:MAG: TIGR01777 family protein [Nitrospirae bacterium]|nr:TIGR01777 family protein [Nitrospirota bacterium]